MRLSARPLLLFLFLSPGLAAPLCAQTSLPEVEARIDVLWRAQDQNWGWDHAEATMRAALAGSTASRSQIDQWGQWMALEFSYVDDVYEQAGDAVRQWGAAVARGEISQTDAAATLRGPLQALVGADARVTRGFSIYLGQMQQRRGWLDRAAALGPSEHCEAYYFALAMADRNLQAAQAALPSDLRHAALFPLPEEDERRTDLDLEPLLPDPEAGPVEQARAYRAILTRLDAAGVPADDPFRGAISQMAEQAEAQMTGAGVLLEAAEAAEGEAQRDILRIAEAAALDRMGSVLPQIIAARAEAGPLSAEDLGMVADFAVRLRQVYDDARNPMALPSGPLRALSGLRAVATLIAGAETGPEAAHLRNIAEDTLTALSPHVPAHGAHAIPTALVAAEVQIMADAMVQSANVLDDISAYIRTGDPQALARALRGSRQVQEMLDPARIARRLLQAEVEGLLANVPGLRALLAEHVEQLLALAPADAFDATHGYTCG